MLKCDHCDFVIADNNELNNHVNNNHKLPQLLKCDQCEFVIIDKDELNNHMISNHNKPRQVKNTLMVVSHLSSLTRRKVVYTWLEGKGGQSLLLK